MSKAYWVVCYREIKEPAKLAAYAKLSGPAVIAGGGRILARGTAAKAYEEGLLPDRHALMFQMQGYATSEPEIRAHVREGYIELTRIVADLAGVPRDETWHFFAHGMMLNVVAMLELDWMPEPAP